MTIVSIIVKALNEERRIASCLEAALAALEGLAGEVVLVDSMSTDRTVDLALRYPVRVVRLDDVRYRGCGAAVELGWRYCRGRLIYVLDADMLLQPGFLQTALAYLEAHPRVAGVGGKLVDTRLNTTADRQRDRRAAGLTAPQQVDDLGGGGLYRREAVEQAGYLAHLSLQAYEEAELGARLRSIGWTLVRLPQTAVLHEGHAETDRQMLARLWRNGRAKAYAVLLRSSIGKPWLGLVLRKLAHVLAVPLMHALALVAALAAGWRGGAAAALAAWAGCWLCFLAALMLRKRSVRLGGWHLLLWHYWAVGAAAGLGQRVGDPRAPIPSRELTTRDESRRMNHAANANVPL